KDYEPILERQIHTWLNYAAGIFHLGQRADNWIRISQDSRAKGFDLRHLGVIIHAGIHQEFGDIISKVKVVISTDQVIVSNLFQAARQVYQQRDQRLAGITDESVEEFYTCTLCQSFASHHVCIVTPERSGLCGAYNWLDCKVSCNINPNGPNQPVSKGDIISSHYGEWQGINKVVREKSSDRIQQMHAYSIMSYPQTSCGCFECIVAFLPEANGFVVVSRNYQGMTPCGMTFTTLASSISGGVQTPGFAGISRLYLLSKKFLRADGGIARIVWLPRELKESLEEKFKQRCLEEDLPDLMDTIADEQQATDIDSLMLFLQQNKHPALEMEPLI
ncbi:MAG: CO dehydrogenase/CO-methylating acetyl-CoA synthase complex subunit beta, partial [Candidatus Electrothrix sp. ATG2]|nr:CO dehydrogenase/CO-methylating acetyl-CoA synthase complex subunit beta [Candidatus Electrothrix sp. ATG2]